MSSPEWRKEKESEIASRQTQLQKFQADVAGPDEVFIECKCN